MNLDELESLAQAATPMYDIDASGAVYSRIEWRGQAGRELKLAPNSHGYMRVRMMVDGKRVSRFVHKLVAEKYLPRRPSPAHEICHCNGDKTDNRASNLRWGTRKDNAADRTAHGRTATGERNGFAKLSDADRAEICFSDLPTKELAARYEVDTSTVCRVRRGQWT